MEINKEKSELVGSLEEIRWLLDRVNIFWYNDIKPIVDCKLEDWLRDPITKSQVSVKPLIDLETVVIPDGIEVLKNKTLCTNNQNIKNIVIPKSIKRITSGFLSQENIGKNINIYYNGTLEDWMNIKIGHKAFIYSNAYRYLRYDWEKYDYKHEHDTEGIIHLYLLDENGNATLNNKKYSLLDHLELNDTMNLKNNSFAGISIETVDFGNCKDVYFGNFGCNIKYLILNDNYIKGISNSEDNCKIIAENIIVSKGFLTNKSFDRYYDSLRIYSENIYVLDDVKLSIWSYSSQRINYDMRHEYDYKSYNHSEIYTKKIYITEASTIENIEKLEEAKMQYKTKDFNIIKHNNIKLDLNSFKILVNNIL